MRHEILERVHAGHLGLRKCKERARSLVFWPGLNSDITELIQSCPTHKKFAYEQPQELLMCEMPVCPWYRVCADIFHFAGRLYVVVFDALSNFSEVEQLSDTRAKTTVEALSAKFSRQEAPVEVCTDNEPQFASHEFALLAKQCDFVPATLSPGYPQSNGLAEKGVQVSKHILKKCTESRGSSG